MADGGRVQLAYIEEVTWGTTPSSALTEVAFATSEDLGMDTSTTLSNAIRGDYVKPQVIRTDAVGTGGFPFELAYGDMDSFMEGALRSDWATAASTPATSLAAVDVDNTFTRAAGSFVTDGWTVGQSGISSGFATAANNGYFVVTAVAALTLTVEGLDLADEAAGGDEVLSNSGSLKNGTTLKSYTLERVFEDLTNTYIAHTGARVSNLSLSAQAGQIVTGAVAFSSKAPSAIAAATAGSGAYSASSAANNEIMNGVDHVTGIFVGSSGDPGATAVTYCVSQIDVSFGSPVRPISCLGTLGPAAIGGNSFEFTGQIRVYLDDVSKALWSDYVNYTAKSLWFRFVDTAGNAYLVYLPQVQLTAADGPNSGGPDSDVMATYSFTAEYNSAAACLACITRIAAA
jgi:hypothetical protein